MESFGGYLDAYSFDRSYEAKLSSDAAILKCDVSEELQFSGVRNVRRPTAYGVDVIQACGYESGSRRITGTVVATTESAARGYVDRQYHFPWIGGSAPGTRYINPPKFQIKPRFRSLVDGIFRSTASSLYTGGGSATNQDTVEIGFEFSEILPNYTYVPTS